MYLFVLTAWLPLYACVCGDLACDSSWWIASSNETSMQQKKDIDAGKAMTAYMYKGMQAFTTEDLAWQTRRGGGVQNEERKQDKLDVRKAGQLEC